MNCSLHRSTLTRTSIFLGRSYRSRNLRNERSTLPGKTAAQNGHAVFKTQMTSPMTGQIHYCQIKWRSRRDNLRNFFLSPPAEMLSFFQQLREAVLDG